MAESAAANEDRQPEDDGDHDVIDDVFLGRVHRDPALRQVERVHLVETAGHDEARNDHADPEDPDRPFDPVQAFASHCPVVNGEGRFLQAGRRAGPTAPKPPHKEGADEQTAEDQETAGDDALKGPINDDIGREKIHDDWEEQKGEEQHAHSGLLPIFVLGLADHRGLLKMNAGWGIMSFSNTSIMII